MASAPSAGGPAPRRAARGRTAAVEGRFYEAEYPELNDMVVVQVRRIVDMGAYATLLEYNGKEGMMLLSELSKYRLRSVTKLLRVGKREICTTLRVDKEKGYIDLSKRRAEPERVRAKEEAFAKAKAVHGIMRHVASTNNVEVDELCKKVSWPLFKKHQDAYEALRRHINGEIDLWQELDFSQPGRDLAAIASKLRTDIEACLRRRLLQQSFRLRAKFAVSCEEYDGIDAVQEALSRGFEASKQDCELRINLIAHPVFVVSCTCQERAAGVAAIDAAMELVERSIKARGGTFRLRSHPDLAGEDLELDSEEGGSSSDEGRRDRGEDADEDEAGSDQEAMPELDEAQMKELFSKTGEAAGDGGGGP